MLLTAKKVKYIFKPLNLNLVVDKIFSCVVNSWRKESQAEENKYLIWTADWGGEHNTPRIHFILLPAIVVMEVIFWTEDNFYFISDCRNQMSIKCPSNASCSSDKTF